MRLTQDQLQGIATAFRSTFASGAVLFLFGSRLDDGCRGGDIDLCIETGAQPWDLLVRARVAFRVQLERVLGERRIDVVLRRRGDELRAIDQEVLTKGVELCRIP